MRLVSFAVLLVVLGFGFAGCVDTGGGKATDWEANIIESRDVNIEEFAAWRTLMDCMGVDRGDLPMIHVAEAGSIRCGEVSDAFACTTSPVDIVIDERFVPYPWDVFIHEAAHAKLWQLEGDPDAGHANPDWFGGDCGVTPGVVVVLSESE